MGDSPSLLRCDSAFGRTLSIPEGWKELPAECWNGTASTLLGISRFPLSSWASLGAQMVKSLPAVQETRVQSLGLEDLLEKGMETHCRILA